MTYKRGVDQLPIPPKDAKVQNVTCDFCIVGCGYKAYSWDLNKQGGTKPSENAFGADLAKQQEAESAAWYQPSMYNIVEQDGRPVHLVIKPDKDCVVNQGLNSVRGGRHGETRYSAQTGTMTDRLTHPMVWRYSQHMPTSWDDALSLVADVTRRVIEEWGEDGVIVSAFDHGGAAGGYENTWGTGKLYFESMKIKNIRIHNRPAYNSEVHATRDMGMGELNNSYEDAELADTIFCVGANSLENQTNYFLAHWVPNMRGTSMDKKKQMMPDEEHAPAKVIIVDPRRTVTANVCEIEAGKDNFLHLAINPGTDLALLNALMTEVVDKGWHAQDFIAKHTSGFDEALAANRTSVDDAAKITGLAAADIRKAAEWIAKPKAGGKLLRRTMMCYEKGLDLGQRQLPHQRRHGEPLLRHPQRRPRGHRLRPPRRPPGRLCPSLRGSCRPAGGLCRPAAHQRRRRHPPHLGDRPLQVDLNAEEFRRVYRRRTNIVKEAMEAIPYGDREAQVDAIVNAIRRGGLFSRRCRHPADPDRRGLPCGAARGDRRAR